MLVDPLALDMMTFSSKHPSSPHTEPLTMGCGVDNYSQCPAQCPCNKNLMFCENIELLLLLRPSGNPRNRPACIDTYCQNRWLSRRSGCLFLTRRVFGGFLPVFSMERGVKELQLCRPFGAFYVQCSVCRIECVCLPVLTSFPKISTGINFLRVTCIRSELETIVYVNTTSGLQHNNNTTRETTMV